MVTLTKGYVAKIEGVTNPSYGKKVLNFFLAMCASGDKKSFELVSANLCQVLLRHIKRVTALKRDSPFVNLTRDELVGRVCEYGKKMGDSNVCVTFSACIDATVLAKSVQVSVTDRAIVRLASPNHF